jgi:hypothetical protein
LNAPEWLRLRNNRERLRLELEASEVKEVEFLKEEAELRKKQRLLSEKLLKHRMARIRLRKELRRANDRTDVEAAKELEELDTSEQAEASALASLEGLDGVDAADPEFPHFTAEMDFAYWAVAAGMPSSNLEENFWSGDVLETVAAAAGSSSDS